MKHVKDYMKVLTGFIFIITVVVCVISMRLRPSLPGHSLSIENPTPSPSSCVSSPPLTSLYPYDSAPPPLSQPSFTRSWQADIFDIRRQQKEIMRHCEKINHRSKELDLQQEALKRQRERIKYQSEELDVRYQALRLRV